MKCLRVMITVSVCSVLVMTDCDPEALKEMHRTFSVCTNKYKKTYTEAMKEGEEEVFLAKITCQLVDNMVVVCGDTWNTCHTQEEVANLKAMYVESLRKNNEKASISIEECESAACAVESAARRSGLLQVTLVMVSPLLDMTDNTTCHLFNSEIGHKIKVFTVNMENISRETPLEGFFSREELRTSPNRYFHISDALRCLLIYKYGGFYLGIILPTSHMK